MNNKCIPDKYVGKVTLKGNWGWSRPTLTSPMQLYPETLYSSSKLPASVLYEPQISSVGMVRISAFLVGYDEKQDTNEEYEICTSKGIKKINVDLSKYKDGESNWLILGTFFFDGSGKEYVKLNRISSENNTRASTVRFEILNDAQDKKGDVWQYLYMGPAKKPVIYGDIVPLNHFSDLQNCLNKDMIESLYVLGILDSEDALFYPDNKITVSDFIKWLNKLFSAKFSSDCTLPLSLDTALGLIETNVKSSNINLEWVDKSKNTFDFFENAHFFDRAPFIRTLTDNLSREQGAVLIYLAYHTFIASRVNNDVWELTFADDFDGDTLNDNWECENKAPAHIQSSRWAKNVTVSNSVMSLNTIKEKLDDYPNLDWTTASVWVKPEKFKQCGGFWQASIKINNSKGINNAFWMIGGGNEIDVVEAHYKNNVHTNYHFEGIQYSENYSSEFDLSKDFHIYALEWTNDEFIYFFDGKEIARKRNIDAKVPLYPIFSTAVINWAGKIEDCANGSSMDVEWVRIYKKR